MRGKLIGYEFLKDLLGTSAFPLERPARVASVTKVTIMSDSLAVPALDRAQQVVTAALEDLGTL